MGEFQSRTQRINPAQTGLVFFFLSLHFAVRTFCTFPVGRACLNVDPLTWLNVSGAVGLHISAVLPAAWGLPVGVVSWQLLDLISDLCFILSFFKDMSKKLTFIPRDYVTLLSLILQTRPRSHWEQFRLSFQSAAGFIYLLIGGVVCSDSLELFGEISRRLRNRHIRLSQHR